MKTPTHYLDLFAGSHTVDRQLVAHALYAAIYGDADAPEADRLAEIARGLEDRPYDATEATALVEAEPLWPDLYDRDPIPPWAVRLLACEVGSQVELARRVGVDPSTVRRWCMAADKPSSAACAGTAARVVRMVAERVTGA